jgi:hypothetical protein
MNIAIQVATQSAAQSAAAEKRLLRRLREAGAVAPGSAVELSTEDSVDECALASLMQCGAVVKSALGGYYLDEGALAARARRGRRVLRRVMLFTFLVAAVLLLALLARNAGARTLSVLPPPAPVALPPMTAAVG